MMEIPILESQPGNKEVAQHGITFISTLLMAHVFFCTMTTLHHLEMSCAVMRYLFTMKTCAAHVVFSYTVYCIMVHGEFYSNLLWTAPTDHGRNGKYNYSNLLFGFQSQISTLSSLLLVSHLLPVIVLTFVSLCP